MMKATISTILILVITNALASSGQEQKELAKPTLSVSVRSAKSSYSIKENIRLEIQLANAGSDSLIVCRNWGWGVGRTYVRVFDVNGKEVFSPFFADRFPPMPRDEDFLQMKPNEVFGIALNESATHFVNTPGMYDVFVEYTSMVTEEWAHKYVRLPRLPLWSRESGTTVSNKIRIEVTE